MSDYKAVPVEPTLEMVEAACDEEQRPLPMWTRMKAIYRAMLAAAPAVQGEPVAWVTADTVDGQTVNGKPRRIWWENNEGVGLPIYATPQPAPDVEALVEALEEARHHVVISPDPVRGGFIQEIDAALAAHCKGGEA